jgi:transcriptional regulator with XRE-family HTH domain
MHTNPHVPYPTSLTAKYLRAHRLVRGMSQAHLAAKAGLGRRAVSQIENGARARVTSLCSLASALGVTVQALRRDDPLKRPPTTPPPSAVA